jgi:tetratricopeptide (TPR) repeat protein
MHSFGGSRTSFVSLTLAALLLALAPTSSLLAQSSRTERRDEDAKSKLQQIWEAGHIERARSMASTRDDVPGLLVRARLAIMAGEDKKVDRLVALAAEKAERKQDVIWLELVRARTERHDGDWKAAEKRMRKILKKHPDAHRVRVELGSLLFAQNAEKEARVVLSYFTPLFNNGRLTGATELTALGRAMRMLGRFDDANYAFKTAHGVDRSHANALVAWGDLLAEKYNLRDAQRNYADALRASSQHPGALVGMARVELETQTQYQKAYTLLARAEKVAPADPRIWMTHAQIGLLTNNCPPVYKYTKQILERRPKYLEAIAYRAACHNLDDDPKQFEAARKQALAINPKYAELFTITAKYATRVHRYAEANKLYRRALELRPNHADAFLGLGIGLSRVGREDEAFEFLKKAFDADPYNVRAFNMLELYEETLPRNYSFTTFEKFKIRAHKDQREIINQLVAPWVSSSIEVFNEKYGYKPGEDLAVEIYPNPSTFGIRSVGLPHITPHGICFGKIVLSRSPSDGNFNWRQVVWHEMAHVYHLQLSNSRVPRWFTEGLAEYETNIKDPAWLRHHDRQIAAKLFSDDGVASVVELDAGFTHAKNYAQILRSYHLASLAIHFIAGEYGFPKIVEMLRAFGEGQSTREAIASVLSLDVEGFDEKFSQWLAKKYLRLDDQLYIEPADIPSLDELQQKLRLSQGNPQILWKLALASMRGGDMRSANQHIERALQRAPRDAKVNYAALLVYMTQGRAKDAVERGHAVLDALQDGYDLRIMLGNAELMLEHFEAARVHFETATVLFPDGIEAWNSLAQLGRSTDDDELYRRALDRMFELDQNNPITARKRGTLYIERAEWSRAYQSADRWVSINPFDPESHRMLIETGTALGRWDEVREAWKSLAFVLDEDRDAILTDGIRALVDAGQNEHARKLAGHARDLDVDDKKIEAALTGSPSSKASSAPSEDSEDNPSKP